MTIDFNTIPVDLRVPGARAEVSNRAARSGGGDVPDRILVIGQSLAGATAVADQALRIFSAGQAVEAAGRGSMLAAMAAVVLKAAPTSEVHILPLDDDAAGTAATGQITVTAAPTAAGSAVFYVAGRRYPVTVAAGDTTAAVATAIAAKITADADALVTAAADGSDVNLTARHKGVAAGAFDIRHSYFASEALPAGLTVTITAFAGGAGDPELDDAIANLGDVWFPTIINPYTDTTALLALEAELLDRYGAMRAIQGFANGAATGTVGELTTFGNSRNSPFTGYIDAGGSPTPAFLWAANVGSVSHSEPDPSRQRRTLPLTEVLGSAQGDRRTWQERQALLENGISTHTVDAAGVVRIERLITTYETDEFGAEDTSYLDETTVRLANAVRTDLVAFVDATYPRSKLGDDGSTGPNVVTPAMLKTAGVNRYLVWADRGWVEGGDAFTQFKRDQVVERDPNDTNRVNWRLGPNFINNLRITAMQIEFRQ